MVSLASPLDTTSRWSDTMAVPAYFGFLVAQESKKGLTKFGRRLRSLSRSAGFQTGDYHKLACG